MKPKPKQKKLAIEGAIDGMLDADPRGKTHKREDSYKLDAPRAWGSVHDGKLSPWAGETKGCGLIEPVRILHEKDFRRLCKAAGEK